MYNSDESEYSEDKINIDNYNSNSISVSNACLIEEFRKENEF